MTNQKPIELPAWAEFAGTDERGTYTIVNLSGVRFRMRWIEPGTFMMGSPEDEDGRYDDETQHEVALTQGYWIAETQCTQELWQAVMGENPSRFAGAQRPVDTVSWEDCQRFIQRANELAPGLDLRLPTEAEWEHACRAGTTGARYGELDNVAWHHGNSESTTHPVGQKVPNAWGLYDMLGNVWEWCADWFGEYPDRAAIDPKGPEEGTFRVLRGGSWFSYAWYVRSAFRYRFDPASRLDFIGVRFARGPKPGEPSGERRENRRADAGGESVASGQIKDRITVRFPWGARAELERLELPGWHEQTVYDLAGVCGARQTVAVREYMIETPNGDHGPYASIDEGIADLPGLHQQLALAYPPDCETMAEMLREEGLADLSVTNGDGHAQLYEQRTRRVLVRFHDNEWTLPNSTFPDEGHKPHEVLQRARGYLASLPPDEQAKWRGEGKAQEPPRFAVGQELTTREQCVAALRGGWTLRARDSSSDLFRLRDTDCFTSSKHFPPTPVDDFRIPGFFVIVGRQRWAEENVLPHSTYGVGKVADSVDDDEPEAPPAEPQDNLRVNAPTMRDAERQAASRKPESTDPPDSIEVEWRREPYELTLKSRPEGAGDSYSYSANGAPVSIQGCPDYGWHASLDERGQPVDRQGCVCGPIGESPQSAVTALEKRLREAVGDGGFPLPEVDIEGGELDNSVAPDWFLLAFPDGRRAVLEFIGCPPSPDGAYECVVDRDCDRMRYVRVEDLPEGTRAFGPVELPEIDPFREQCDEDESRQEAQDLAACVAKRLRDVGWNVCAPTNIHVAMQASTGERTICAVSTAIGHWLVGADADDKAHLQHPIEDELLDAIGDWVAAQPEDVAKQWRRWPDEDEEGGQLPDEPPRQTIDRLSDPVALRLQQAGWDTKAWLLMGPAPNIEGPGGLSMVNGSGVMTLAALSVDDIWTLGNGDALADPSEDELFRRICAWLGSLPSVEMKRWSSGSQPCDSGQLPDVLLAAVWMDAHTNGPPLVAGESEKSSREHANHVVECYRKDARNIIAGLRAAGLGGVLCDD